MPYIQLAALLAALATVGPFSIDTYLPALHAIGEELNATPLEVQQTLTAYMLPMGAMVLWHGAFSDALETARDRARYIENTTGNTQKLLLASWQEPARVAAESGQEAARAA